MLIVTIGTVQQSFINAMPERPAELRPHFDVTAVAQLRLWFYELELAHVGVVHGVALQAGAVVYLMSRAREVAVFLRILMTAHAGLADGLGRDVLEIEDFGNVAAAI